MGSGRDDSRGTQMGGNAQEAVACGEYIGVVVEAERGKQQQTN
jgi:hypothetical protein